MSTLRAAVEISDRTSAKFDRMAAAAKRFEKQIDSLSDKINRLQMRLEALGSKRISPKLDLDTTEFDRKMAEAKAKMALIHQSDWGASLGGAGIPSIPGGGGSSSEAASGGSAGGPVVIGRNRRVTTGGISQINNGVGGFISFLVRAPILIYKAVSKIEKILEPVFTTFFKFIGRGLDKLGDQFGKLDSAFNAVGGTLIKLAPALASGTAGFAAIGIAAALLVPILGGLSQVLLVVISLLGALLVPIGAVLPIVASFFGVILAGVVPMFMWIKQTKDLVDQKTKLEDRLKTLTPGTKEYADTLLQLADTQKKLNESGGESIYNKISAFGSQLKAAVFTPGNQEIFTKALEEGLRAIQPLLPVITNAVAGFSQVIANVMKQLADFTNSPQGMKEINGLVQALVPIAQLAGEATGKLARMFMNLTRALAPIAGFLLKEFNDWMDKLNKRLSTTAGQRSIQEWMTSMYPVFQQMVVVVKEFVVGLVDMAREAAPLAISFLSWLRDVGPKIVEWIQHMSERWGPIFWDMLGVIGRLFGVVGSLVESMAERFAPVIAILFGEGGTMDKAIDITETLIGWFDKIAPAIDPVSDGFKFAAMMLDLVIAGMKWVIDNIGKFKDAWDWVGDKLGKLDPRNWGDDDHVSQEELARAIAPNGPGETPFTSGVPNGRSMTTNSRGGMTVGTVVVKPNNFDEFVDEMGRLFDNMPLGEGAG